MLRAVLVVVVVCLLWAPYAARRALRVSHGEASQRSNGRVLRVITPHTRTVRQAFEQAFAAWHTAKYGQSVELRYLVPGGSNDVVRYLRELYSQRAEPGESVGVDVVWGGGDYTFEHELKDFLQRMRLPDGLLEEVFPVRNLGGVSLLDPDPAAGPRWVGVVLSSFGIVSSPVFMERLGLVVPTTWRELARPELKGLLALADPTRSGSVAMAYMMVLQKEMATAEAELHASARSSGAQRTVLQHARALDHGFERGMRVLTTLSANARYFTDSSSRLCEDVANADAAAGVAIDFYARAFQQEVGEDRIAYHAPRAATAITPDPVAVLRGTTGERRKLAERFVEFLLSREGQRLWALPAQASPHLSQSLRRLPIRRDVYDARDQFVDSVSPFEDAREFNVRAEWMSLFIPLRLLWAAAYIDAGGELREAYSRVLSIVGDERREQALVQLMTLPLDRRSVLREGAGMRDDRLHEDSHLRKARRRQRWARLFRRHYRAVAPKEQ